MDSIPSEIIKGSYDNISPFLLKLYDKMYNTGEYPARGVRVLSTQYLRKEMQTIRRIIAELL